MMLLGVSDYYVRCAGQFAERRFPHKLKRSGIISTSFIARTSHINVYSNTRRGSIVESGKDPGQSSINGSGQTATHQTDSGSLEMPTGPGGVNEKNMVDAQARAGQENSTDSLKSKQEGVTAQESGDGRNGEAEVSRSVSTVTESTDGEGTSSFPTYRITKKPPKKELNFIEGILEEVQLIEWPSPLQAVTDTTLVIAIVAFTAIVLFGVNATLADLSNILYK
eukprot:jgi/Botrbrau1/1810/Bobra.146_1s0008.1